MSNGFIDIWGADRVRVLLLSVTILAVLYVCLGVRSTSAAAICPNEAIRAEQGAEALPDCRAYEMVSPLGSTPAAVSNERNVASNSGDTFGYLSWNPYMGQQSPGLLLRSSRTGAGWLTQVATPPQGGLRESDNFACNPSVYYSVEMESAVSIDGYKQEESACEGDTPPLVESEPRGIANLFLHSYGTGQYWLLDSYPLKGEQPANAFLVDATSELDHVVFSEQAALTPEALGKGVSDLYEEAKGKVRLVSVLPDGAPVEGSLANGTAGEQGSASLTHALSTNGESLFFYHAKSLYIRVNAMQEQSAVVAEKCTEVANACTTQVDRAESGAEGPSGGGVFVDASADGSRVFFTDEYRLTANATAEATKPDLYEYDVSIGKLTDLTVDAAEPAAVTGYMGASEDGAYLYFVANGRLTEANPEGIEPVAGSPNLYMWHAGTTTFVATLNAARSGEYGESAYRVTADGRFLAFNSVEELTKYDNLPQDPSDCVKGAPCREIFLFDALDKKLACVSCAPSGLAPTGPAELRPPQPTTWYGGPIRAARTLTEDGRVFFDTRTPLLSQASNGVENVYAYQNGHLSLISTGTGSSDSEVLEASASGNDVFFTTDQGLVGADTDNADSVYDARVNGGFLAPSGVGSEPPPCSGVEACRSPLSEPPSQQFAGSGVFSGAGNLAPQPAKGNVTGGVSGKRAAVKLKRAQRLTRALRQCRHRPKAKQRACRRRARRRFGPREQQHRVNRVRPSHGKKRWRG